MLNAYVLYIPLNIYAIESAELNEQFIMTAVIIISDIMFFIPGLMWHIVYVTTTFIGIV